MPDMTPVDSSNVAAIGYDESAEEIHVEFLNGRSYKYLGADSQTFEELQSAPSVGSFINRMIKPNFAVEEI